MKKPETFVESLTKILQKTKRNKAGRCALAKKNIL